MDSATLTISPRSQTHGRANPAAFFCLLSGTTDNAAGFNFGSRQNHLTGQAAFIGILSQTVASPSRGPNWPSLNIRSGLNATCCHFNFGSGVETDTRKGVMAALRQEGLNPLSDSRIDRPAKSFHRLDVLQLSLPVDFAPEPLLRLEIGDNSGAKNFPISL